MLINLYNQVILTSIIFGAVYFLVKFLNHNFFQFFSAKWHYYIRVSIYIFFLLPFYGVISNILIKIKAVQFFMFIAPTTFSEINKHDTVSRWFKTNEMLNFTFLPYFWLGGVAIFIIVYLIERHKFKQYIFQTCKPSENTESLNLLLNCKSSMGVKAKTLLYSSPYITTPFIYGIFRPIIVLPEKNSFTSTELQYIFFHELTHWKRRDSWINCLIVAIHAVHWFNPFVSFIRRDIDRFCEFSCDESVTLSMNKKERRGYCSLLLKVSWDTSVQHSRYYSAFGSAKQSQLERRLNMVLKRTNDKRVKRTSSLFTLVSVAVILLGSISVHAAIESEANAGYTTVHKHVEGEQSISATSTSDSDFENDYTPRQTVHEPVEGEKSISGPSEN